MFLTKECSIYSWSMFWLYMCLANPILFFMINLVFEIVEYFNEGQCNEIKLSAFIYHNLSRRLNKICWCTYIKNFLTFQESLKALLKLIDVRTNLNIFIRDFLKNWYSAYINTKCPFKLPKFVQPPLDHYNMKVYILKSDRGYHSIKAPVCQWVSESVCLFPDSSETATPVTWNFEGWFPLGLRRF